ncbi:MAG: hypothetical protein OXC08_19195 [Thiotrichales bacterium]|nr:hypothetical protein [Thiotrichales bacterium]
MVQTDTSTLDLTAVAGTLERGELTSLELTEAVLEPTARLNPRLQALSDVTARSARREARRAGRSRVFRSRSRTSSTFGHPYPHLSQSTL